jgi:hypothetical protein
MTGKTKAQLEGENIVMRNVIDRMKAESRDCSQCVYLKIAQENPAVGTEPDMDGKTKAELEAENKILREKLDKYANADLARRRAMRAELAEEPIYRAAGKPSPKRRTP